MPNKITKNEIDNIHKEYIDNDFDFDVDNFYKKYKLTEKEADQIEYYKGSGYRRLNEWLRAWQWDEEFANTLSNSLKKLPKYEWEVYRWIEGNSETKKMFDNIKVWEIYKDDGFMSTTTLEKFSKNFMNWSDGYKFVIKSKNWAFIWNAWESEVLFDRWTEFKVLKKEGHTIYLEEI